MPKLVMLAGLVCALAGCTVSFDPNNLACDGRRQCLAGYVCDPHNQCVLSSAGSSSGSTGTTGRSSGSGSSSGGTTGGPDCTRVGCPFEERCVPHDGGQGGSCQPLAFACRDDGGCADGVCLHNGTARGFCSAPCAEDGGCPAGSTCDVSLVGTRGNPTSRCLPSAAHNCGSSRACSAPLSTCLPFDAPTTSEPSLPLGFCDLAPLGAAASGSRCTADRDCASGLCAATQGGGVCLEGCADTMLDCTLGATCSAVRILTTDRITRACVSTATTCQGCGGCGPDAPDCDAAGRCVLGCRTADSDACGPAPRTCIGGGVVSAFCSGEDGGGC